MKIITNEPDEPPRRILLVRLSALGDVIHCLPALEALHELWPAAEIDWICESLSAPLLEGHPLLRRVIRLPRKQWMGMLRQHRAWPRIVADWERVLAELRRDRYDLVLDLQGNLRSAAVSLLARHDRRIGHHPTEVRERAPFLRNATPHQPSGRVHRIRKQLHLVRALGWDGEEPAGRLPAMAAERHRLRELLPPGAPPVLLHPFVSAAGLLKAWPPRFYAELATILGRRGHRVLITWARQERQRAERIVDEAAGAAGLAPECENLREVAALLSLAGAVVAADTGPLHLAALTGVPVVGLYGPKDPIIYGPWSPRRRIVTASVACSPCTLHRCEHAICMQMIFPEHVANAVEEIIERAPGTSPAEPQAGPKWTTGHPIRP